VTKVSVIVPVYNVEQYLAECLESVLAQGMTEFEVICVDDGSTDESARILARFATRDPRIIVVTQENSGVSRARNVGMTHVCGEYVCFLDSDDLLVRDALEVLYATAAAGHLDLLHFDTEVFFEDDAVESEHSSYAQYYQRNSSYSGVQTGVELLAAMIENGDHKPAPCLRFLRAGFCRDEGLSFREGVIHEDNAYAFRCDLSARRAGYIDRKLHRRRMRAGSIITTRSGPRTLEGCFAAYMDMLRCVAGRDDPEHVARALARRIAAMNTAAVRSYCELPAADRGIDGLDNGVDTFVEWKLLTRHAAMTRRAERAEARLASCEDSVRRTKESRWHRLGKTLRSVLGRSK
jgi:glycosyltransferase involved in cell wall biosynthesis